MLQKLLLVKANLKETFLIPFEDELIGK